MTLNDFYEPKVSVIIPMYNAEEYIEQCLQSCLNQTLNNIEVIVVNDRSTDNSVELVRQMLPLFDENKSLTMLTTKKNTGWSSLPRNFGIDYAHGKYIAFIDNDDFLEANALETFYNVAEKFEADVVHAERVFYENGDNSIISTIQKGEFVKEPTLETLNLAERINKFTKKQTNWWVWNKFYSRKFLVDNKIKFPNMTTFEDLVFTLYCIVTAEKFVRIPDVLYHWRTLRNSNSHKPVTIVEFMEHAGEAVKQLDDYMRSEKFFVENPDYRYSVIDFFLQERIDILSKNIFTDENISLGKMYTDLYNLFFSKNPKHNVAFATYSFMAANVYKLYTKHQAKQIEDLRRQLAEFQR